jgi:hypothetical protein
MEGRAALAVSWRAFAASRALIWASGIGSILVFGWAQQRAVKFDPLLLTVPSGPDLLNLLIAPAARFDSAWYLAIAHYGYAGPDRAAFFPLLPLLIVAGGKLVGSQLAAAIAVSSACGAGALVLLHRLAALETSAEVARATVWVVACFPTALALSAVYTEGLFLLVTVGAILAARSGRWWLAGVLAALAAATRSAGVLIAVPLLAMYLYGPRSDAAPRKREPGERPWRPLYAPRADLLAIGLAPLGLLAYLAYLGVATGDPTSAFSAQSEWSRSFIPLGGIALGALDAAKGVLALIPGPDPFAVPAQPYANAVAARDIVFFCFLLLFGWLTFEVWQRLRPPYLAYCLSSLALPLSVPSAAGALLSLPRFGFVVFPLWIALAEWSLERGVLRRVVAVELVLLGVFTCLFTTWAMAP